MMVKQWAAVQIGLCLGVASMAGGVRAETAAAACDAPADQLLQAAPAIEARAHWLDARQIAWPGMAVAGSYKLYHSAAGRLTLAQGRVSGADGVLSLQAQGLTSAELAGTPRQHLGAGARLSLPAGMPRETLQELLRQQLLLVHEPADGAAPQATGLQLAGALDDLYAAAAQLPDLGVSLPTGAGTRFKLWAPTAQAVSVCIYPRAQGRASRLLPLSLDAATGAWSGGPAQRLDGQYYRYLLQVFVPGVGLVRNLVTDPYALSLSADSQRSYIADLAAARLQPPGWAASRIPAGVEAPTDMAIYELHVRDFSIGDDSVPAAHRGKYLAFTDSGSRGMRHLRALRRAGITDVHLLPVFDIASIPERGCLRPKVPKAAPDSERQQAAVMALAGRDCYNWGYDPWHYNAPEGSYASDAEDGARRVLEFRRMVMGLHQAGLRVGMDVVYNHSAASGQAAQSVLDRIVPGYYQRLDAAGRVERSTCCDNTATEHLMMGKLLLDSVLLWAREYKIASFRFDLMGHQPRALMEQLQARLRRELGREVQLIGEGWNFGEVANGARFVQASQLSLNGSGIGTFSDRARDAIRGGSAADSGEALRSRQGYVNGLVYDPNGHGQHDPEELLRAADLVRVGLAGSLREFELETWTGERKRLDQIDYAGQPAGYASQPAEVVNYVDNHDNQTLFDINVWRLPRATSAAERARVQVLAAALNSFSQGVAYFHAGLELLRSKSLDRNSYESGDWFNRLDWSLKTNFFGSGLPPQADNGADFTLMRPLLADPAIKPGPVEIAWTNAALADLLRIRASSTLFRLRSAAEVRQRLQFLNTGPSQNPVVIAAKLDGRGHAGAGWRALLYFVNVDKQAHELVLPSEAGQAYRLHPVQAGAAAADRRVATGAAYAPAQGRFSLPARSAVVFVLD
ncbi:alpha-1,6-glucosidase domain-containing protein [Paucibacter soli]|uniref:alpha-1,6-glucosidase domain-containing protein n=1 Tax=Paucibacter soli TaxID=3133433 RepID=UPI0030AAA572